MTEILTESFCERCGTRYTFETVQQRGRPLSRLGTIGRGLKNFVVMPEASFDEAMAVARSDDESRSTTAHLEAFHRTFNFCLTCRQYTCAECWNGVEGRCLTCAPMPLEEPAELPQALATTVMTPPTIAASPVAAAPVVAPSTATPPAPSPTIEIRPTPPPEADVAPDVEPAAQPEPVAQVVAEPVAALDAAPDVEPVVEAEPVAQVAEPEPGPEAPVAAAEAEPSLVADTPPVTSFPGFLPGRSLDDEIAAYELRIAALAQIPASPEPAIQPTAVVHREPIRTREHTARAPVAMAAEATREPSDAISETADHTAMAPMPGTCRSCGLSISASARFCRRCGTRQES